MSEGRIVVSTRSRIKKYMNRYNHKGDRVGQFRPGKKILRYSSSEERVKQKESAQRGGRTHSLQIKSLTLYRLS